MSIEQKLQLIFSEGFQIKRVSKEISNIRQVKQKYCYQFQMSFVRGASLTFHIYYQKGAFKRFKKLQNLASFQIKIILSRDYPAKPPLLFCMSDTMIDYGIEPFRDYSEFLTVDWSAKFTIIDIIKLFPEFLDGWNNEDNRKGRYLMNESYETQKLFSWSFLQTFPVRFAAQKNTSGLIVINCQNQIILLEEVGNKANSFHTKDLIKISEIVSIFKSKQHDSQILLEIKKGQFRQSLVFRSDDRENIVNYIIQYMKIVNTLVKKKQHQEQSGDSQSSNEELQQNLQQYEDLSKQSPSKLNIQEIKEEIVLYQSLIQSSMTSQNVSNLVILLKKAIEYYSAIGKQQFQIYLKKLKTIMSNQMAQVLLDSAEQSSKKKEQTDNTSDQNSSNKQNFTSIIEMI